jgi:hypothetical protein
VRGGLGLLCSKDYGMGDAGGLSICPSCIVDGVSCGRCGELCRVNMHTMPVQVRVCYHVGYTAFLNEEPRPRGERYSYLVSSRLHAITIIITCQCGRYTYTYFLIGGGSDDQCICLFASRPPHTVVNTFNIDILPGVGQIRAVVRLLTSQLKHVKTTRQESQKVSGVVLPGQRISRQP